MGSVGLSLLLSFGTPAAPPEGSAPAPRLQKGDELHYKGEIVEVSERVDNRYRKTQILEVRLFILDTTDEAAFGALLTSRTMADDPAIAKASIIKPSLTPVATLPVVRLDLIRIDKLGGVEWVEPKEKLPPFDYSKAVRRNIELPKGELTSDWELGFLTDFSRMPTEQGKDAFGIESIGGKTYYCYKWAEDSKAKDSGGTDWQVNYSLITRQSEVARVKRELSLGKDWKLTTRYELQPTTRAIGARYLDTKKEIETAWAFHSEIASALQKPGKLDLGEFRQRSAKIQRYLDDNTATTGFRPALEMLKRRCDAIASSVIPAIESTNLATLKVGEFGPGFIAADVEAPKSFFRLEAAKGKPVVLAFYKPNSKTSEEALTITEALYRKYGEKAAIIPLALGAETDMAVKERKKLKFTVPIFEGNAARKSYRVETFPQFFVLDGAGKLRWSFDAGVGPEVGFLVKEQLDKLLAEKQ